MKHDKLVGSIASVNQSEGGGRKKTKRITLIMHGSIISFLFLFPGSEFMDLLHYMGWGCKSIVTDGVPRMHHNTNTGSKSPTT